jgi:hypothetical protein
MKVLGPADVSAGLPAAAAAAALLGKAGAAAILVLLFLAVTSACLSLIPLIVRDLHDVLRCLLG